MKLHVKQGKYTKDEYLKLREENFGEILDIENDEKLAVENKRKKKIL